MFWAGWGGRLASVSSSIPQLRPQASPSRLLSACRGPKGTPPPTPLLGVKSESRVLAPRKKPKQPDGPWSSWGSDSEVLRPEYIP